MPKPSIVIVGRLGGDPEPVADGKGLKFSVATNVAKDVTDWYSVTVWSERQKEFATKYFKKGSAIVVTGLVTIYKGDKGQYVNVEAVSLQFPGIGGKKQETEKTEAEKTIEAEADDIPF
jgi:single-stranded DNA-binding protein